MSFARVVLDSPLPQLDRLFDYRVPPELEGAVAPGVRVRVPLRGGRAARGYVVELAERSEFAEAARDVAAVVSPARVLDPAVWRLARELADRAAGSANDILRLAIPPRQARVEKAFLEAQQGAPEDVPAVQPPAAAGPALPGPALPELGVPGLDWAGAVQRGERFALTAAPGPVRLEDGGWAGGWAAALAALAAHCLAQGRSAILCVPDYRDVEQLARALSAVVEPERLVRLDTRQSEAARYRGFLRTLLPQPVVVLGNRSAVYAPAHALGAILLWDDGDPLHREPLAPYVHVRDAALVRARQAGCALVLAAHGRSPEAERLVRVGWLRAVSVPAPRPHVMLATAAEPGSARIPPLAWRTAREALRTGPVLVQVGQPGHSPVLLCAECRRPARCARCGGPLRKASASAAPACGWCGALAAAWSCAHCGSERMRPGVAGSSRTAEELAKAFPSARVLVSDGQSPRTLVDARAALVVATRGAEPLAAGGYAAVLLLDGERMLARESLFVADDCLRQWSNAVALARPGAPCVLAGVGGPVAQALATWRQPEFARRELEQRAELRFPPAVRSATVTGAPDAVAEALSALDALDDVDVLGPVEEGGIDRAIVRFGYARGEDVASALRAALVRSATGRRRAVAAGRAEEPELPRLRIRMDDPDVW